MMTGSQKIRLLSFRNRSWRLFVLFLIGKIMSNFSDNAFVFSWNAASTSSSLKMSTNVVVIPYCGSVCSNKLKDPP